MTGEIFMKILIAEYLVAALLFACEKNWPKTFYWLSAAGISGAVLFMK